MSWIQENRFAAGLGGATAVAAIGLIAFAVSQGSGYSKAKEDYDALAGEVSTMTDGKLYPKDAYLSEKEKAVRDYKEDVTKLQDAFKKFQAPQPPNIDPGDFNTAVIKARDAAAKAITDAKGEVPAEFFIGFEAYKESAVKKEATGVLTFELDGISQLMENLAAAGPVKLLNLHRPHLAEEDGKPFDATGKMLRALPFEMAINCKEETFRKFLSALDDSKHYYVIRSIRVTNEKPKAPTAADAEFKSDEPAATGGGAGGDAFGGGAGGFVLPGEPEPAAPATPAPAPAAAAPAAGGDGIILKQVLGSEGINVFLRLDIVQFLEPAAPAAKAPKK
ncbi:Amuc_1100 family pilus-like protein [Haloferula sp. BvORR071]|uniref:Amuc_1100 family pilus-like protein n=1 Tax=Haloferula sp. BvORR071 TaxID=1396141 RepID=UPI000558DEE0|nr:Amuc_1100 family pilus-like protein [Haloferula sp. BvORR071]